MNAEFWGYSVGRELRKGSEGEKGGGVEDEEREEEGEEEEEEEEEGMRCGGGAAGCCGKLHADTTDGAGRQVATRGDRRQGDRRRPSRSPALPGGAPGRRGDALPPAHAEDTGLVDMVLGARC